MQELEKCEELWRDMKTSPKSGSYYAIPRTARGPGGILYTGPTRPIGPRAVEYSSSFGTVAYAGF